LQHYVVVTGESHVRHINNWPCSSSELSLIKQVSNCLIFMTKQHCLLSCQLCLARLSFVKIILFRKYQRKILIFNEISHFLNLFVYIGNIVMDQGQIMRFQQELSIRM
jgi:hypothetical protein